MSVSTTRPAHTSSVRTPVLTPLHGAHLESFRANADGTYRCGSNAASQFRLTYAGAEFTHCCFFRKAGSFSVMRIDGRVWVNDLPASGLTQLTEGDVISLGPVSYRLEFQDAPSCLPELDDRPSRMTAQWNELALKQEELHEQERANVRRSLELDTQRQVLADQQRQLTDAVEKHFRMLAAVEQAQLEQTRQEAGLRTLHEQIQAAETRCMEQRAAIEAKREELDRRESGISEREVLVSGQLEDIRCRFAEFDLRAAELRQHESDIDYRAADVHRLIQQFKSDRHSCRETNRTSPSADDLRSELANLFGLEKPAVENVTPPLPPAAFVDLSEPPGTNPSVVHFGFDSAPLAATESTESVVGDVESVCEKSSDDFVRDYMEQLLSRNRKSSGVPQGVESKAADRKKDPAADFIAKAAEGQTPKSLPRVKSYTHQYMAENLGTMDGREPMTMSGPNIEAREIAAFDEERPVQVRQKIDLLKLKENMASFRALSAQSVESALASHAIDVQRLGFSRRTLFAVLLILSSVVLVIANVYGAIDAPMLIWVTLISAIAIFFELFQQYRAIAVHTRNPLDLLFTSARAKKHIQRSIRPTASTSVVANSASNREMSVTDESEVHARTFDRSESLPAEVRVSKSGCRDH